MRFLLRQPSLCLFSIKILVIFSISLLASPTVADEQKLPNRPNIVFLLADDLGYGDLGCYGCPDTQTPHLDKLAKQGVRFTAHYANGPECTPTRVAFLTGRYQQWVGGLECAIGTGNIGRYDDAVRLRETHDLGLPSEVQTISRLLQQSGYVTALFGKWHLGYEPKFAPSHHGFDQAFYCIGGGMDYFHYIDNVGANNLYRDGQPTEADGYFTDLATDAAVEFLRQKRSQPFFLYVPYTTPHSPFQGPNDRRPNPLPLDSPLWNQGRAPHDVYVAMNERMDQCVGRILQALDEQGLADNTVVFFASDNGGTRSARNTPFSNIKGTTYEGGIRVPAIVRWPGVVPANLESDQPCMTFDFSASIASIAGVASAEDQPLEGIDIVTHAANRTPDFDRTLYWRKPRGDTVWQGVRDGALKFITKKKGDQLEEHLFDLTSDPAESNDLKADRPDDFLRLKRLYDDWEQRVRRNRRGSPGWRPTAG